ncbi:hypothetical protein SSX86_003531 [Deinandra increscens subsp. villosa]|uniref:Integrase catalytic domain-containing protein n=1 Tax=Deinandra increscens subsp. villosa TaxID=3103831 RepID=A0AAP0HA04_9ASTR
MPFVSSPALSPLFFSDRLPSLAIMSTGASSSSDNALSMGTVVHLLAHKLTSTNYLLWRNHMSQLLAFQHLLSHVDGSSVSPPETTTSDNKTSPNPAYEAWKDEDQKAALILLSSLTDESAPEVLNMTSARQIWVTLEAVYSNASVERAQNLKDQLRHLTKGNQSVAEFGRRFKDICDRLAAIGQPVEEADKSHWFLSGLGPDFSMFTIATRAIQPIPPYRDVLARAEGHEILVQNNQPTPPPAAFTAQRERGNANNRSGRGSNNNRRRPSNNNNNFGGNNNNSRRYTNRNNRNNRITFGDHSTHSEPCQLCGIHGHYAPSCPTHVSARREPTPNEVAQAFSSQCHVGTAGPDWYVDSGATHHMASSSNHVDHSHPYFGNSNVTFGNGNTLTISHKGHAKVANHLNLKDILIVPHLTKNLISISKLTADNNMDVLFSFPYFYVQDRDTKQVLAQGRCEQGLYVLQEDKCAFISSLNNSAKASFELWHARLGHANFDVISMLNKFGLLQVTSILPKPIVCSSCQMAKGHRLPFTHNDKRATNPLDLIHCDLWGPSPVQSAYGYKYYVAFVDDFSRFTWFYPLKAKSDFYATLVVFSKFVETQFDRKIKIFQSDGGTEFVNRQVKHFFDQNGTFHRLSCPYTPQQNGRVERKHRHIVETGLAMLFNGQVPTKYWVEAFSTAVFVINRLPSKILSNKSPFHMLFSQNPRYENFRVFGCRVFPYLRDYTDHKLAPRSLPCIFFGYSSQHKGFKCFEPTTNRVFITRHARFDEQTLPFVNNTTSDFHRLEISKFQDDTFDTVPQNEIPKPPLTNIRPVTQSPCTICEEPAPLMSQNPINQRSIQIPSTPPPQIGPEPPNSPQPQIGPEPPTSPQPQTQSTPAASLNFDPAQPVPTHPMLTRAKSGIHKPNPRYAHVAHKTSSLKDPKTFKTAQKFAHWNDAMQKEMTALHANNTWKLVPRPTGCNIVGSKWLYRTKYRSDGTIERFKARLVAQGYSQVPGLDYNYTFSPVVKASTIRVVLALAVIHDWKLHQLDVNNAFLHGSLDEQVYMEQPPGFINPNFPDYVCHLNKALYGLKQAPRAWFQRLSNFLITNGFSCSKADPSLFVFRKNTSILYLLVYVDDLIITGNQEDLVTRFITRLNKEFATKDLGNLHYFLGLQASHTPKGLFLNQANYATDIIERAKLTDAKPVSTPMSTGLVLTSDGDPFEDATLYRSLVGALQYLTITRPDISYSVNQVSQFLQSPTKTHFQAVKRIIRYIKGTFEYGLMFCKPTHTDILGYSDSDWARCIETRRSTHGYSIFLGGNLVSWSAKKQPTVSRSSCEAEYRAMANAAAEIIWLTHILRELHALPPDRPTLLCDNQSALFLTQNPVSHKRAKHIDLDYHFIRELVMSGKLHTKFVPTKLQVADIFTKSLSQPQFEFFREKLCLGPPPYRLRGDINV